jgi:hypothetical protein
MSDGSDVPDSPPPPAGAFRDDAPAPATPVLQRTFDNPLHEDEDTAYSPGTTVTDYPQTPGAGGGAEEDDDDETTPVKQRGGTGEEGGDDADGDGSYSMFSPGTTAVVHTARKELRSAAAA